MKLPSRLRKIFWDVDLLSLDIKKHANFMIARISEKGRWADVLWMKNNFSITDIKRIIKRSKNTSVKTKNFWKVVY